MKNEGETEGIVYTIGHSNRSLEEFLDLLEEFGVEVLVDVRKSPTSRANPHFSRDFLERALRERGIDYVWLGEELGGWRKLSREERESDYARSIRSEGFRAYAFYMRTNDFRKGARKLEDLARRKRIAIMCAERIFFRCHRKFISDYLVARGFRVVHIVDKGRILVHKLSDNARIVDGEPYYL